jgi:hypothetical protein
VAVEDPHVTCLDPISQVNRERLTEPWQVVRTHLESTIVNQTLTGTIAVCLGSRSRNASLGSHCNRVSSPCTWTWTNARGRALHVYGTIFRSRDVFHVVSSHSMARRCLVVLRLEINPDTDGFSTQWKTSKTYCSIT